MSDNFCKIDELIEREGLYYKKFTDVPFTGKVDGEEQQGSFKDGKRDGSWINYYSNGQLCYKGEYKNGKRYGSWFYYYNNGQLNSKGNFWLDDKEGSWVFFYKDGFIDEELSGTYKNDIRISD